MTWPLPESVQNTRFRDWQPCAGMRQRWTLTELAACAFPTAALYASPPEAHSAAADRSAAMIGCRPDGRCRVMGN